MSDEQPCAEASEDDPTTGSGMSQPAGASGLSLGEKLDRCLRTMHAPDRGPWSLREVAEGTAAISDEGSWSAGYLSKVRAGKVTNPSFLHMQTLAEFFHVPLTYFTGNAEEVEAIDAEIEFIQAMRNPDVKDIALRASSLGPSGLRAVTRIISAITDEIDPGTSPAEAQGADDAAPRATGSSRDNDPV